MIKELIDTVISNGDRGAVVPFSRVENIRNNLRELKDIEGRASWVDRMINHITPDENKFIPENVKFKPCSLISVLIHSPKVILQFSHQGKSVQCVIPPHYTNWEINNDRVSHYINDYLEPFGYYAALSITFPQKLLAVHSGLAKYGRNNICYNEEFGSYMQINTYISDMPCDEAPWYPLSRMDICDNCCACVNACPTGAISKDNRLVNTDKCITLFNENPGEFPDWLDKNAHNSITGCTLCQDCCPANAVNEDNVKMGVSFTEEETLEMLNYKEGTLYSDTLGAKIKETGIDEGFSTHFPRNLATLLDKE